ncbi:MAG: putative sulfate exporter family transporter, partial [Rhodoferax sp.]|nr:putative sulfate exporter family transporter [Rhodoferax sp.]
MSKNLIPEDWTVVLLSFVIIIFSLAGLQLSVPEYNWSSITELAGKILNGKNLLLIALQFIYVYIIAIVGSILIGKPIINTAKAFLIVYLLTTLALIAAGSSQMKALSLEAVIFSLLIGLIIGNFFKLPAWFREVLASEFYVKIGLVLLGTSIILSDILKAGSLGLIQALMVVISVWYFSFWVCKKLNIDSELTMMLSSAVSICGVSAAIATSGAIKGDPKKLSLVISLVLIVAVPMMIFMPYIAKV